MDLAQMPVSPEVHHSQKKLLLIVAGSILLFLVIVAFVAFSFYKPTSTQLASAPTPTLRPKIVVTPTTTYDNPFDKKTTYTNPFQKETNPFDNLAQ